MKRMKQTIEVKLQTEKKHLIPRLRLAMSKNCLDMVQCIAQDFHSIKSLLTK